MSIELKQLADWHASQACQVRKAAECGTAAENKEPVHGCLLRLADWHDRQSHILRAAIQQSEPQQPATPEPGAVAAPHIAMGFGRYEVGSGTYQGTPCIAFGKNGTGKVGEFVTMEPRQMSTEETVAVITFANVEGLDVLQEKVDEVRALHFPDTHPATPHPATGEPVEDELNCAEEVLDAITCEFSDGEFPVTDFSCIGDYITAVVNVFKERLAAKQPATGEPVWFHKHWYDGDDIFYRPDDNIPPGSVPLYTHPAPVVPDGWVVVKRNAIESALQHVPYRGETWSALNAAVAQKAV